MKRPLNPGRFRHQITFLIPPKGRSKSGSVTGEWLPFKTVRSSKEPLIGKELYASFTSDTKMEVKFKMRYFRGVTDKMRIQHREMLYDIISAINVDEADIELVCYCRAVNP